MEYINTIDNKVDDILNNNIFYSVLIIVLIPSGKVALTNTT